MTLIHTRGLTHENLLLPSPNYKLTSLKLQNSEDFALFDLVSERRANAESE